MASRDADGDQIPDRLDRCPQSPEDRDGFEDDDGCPDPDNDQDGLLDSQDPCPNEPETKYPMIVDGCPDRVHVRPVGRPVPCTIPIAFNLDHEWSDELQFKRGSDEWLSPSYAELAVTVLVRASVERELALVGLAGSDELDAQRLARSRARRAGELVLKIARREKVSPPRFITLSLASPSTASRVPKGLASGSGDKMAAVQVHMIIVEGCVLTALGQPIPRGR